MKRIETIVETISYVVGCILLAPILIIWKAIENRKALKAWQERTDGLVLMVWSFFWAVVTLSIGGIILEELIK